MCARAREAGRVSGEPCLAAHDGAPPGITPQLNTHLVPVIRLRTQAAQRPAAGRGAGARRRGAAAAASAARRAPPRRRHDRCCVGRQRLPREAAQLRHEQRVVVVGVGHKRQQVGDVLARHAPKVVLRVGVWVGVFGGGGVWAACVRLAGRVFGGHRRA
jgi:hypothetical protein